MSAASRLTRAWPIAALLLAGCAGQLERKPAVPTACGTETGAPWLGCANRANLAAVVADPADLKRGRALTPGSASRAAEVLEAYEAPATIGAAAEMAKTETTK